MIAIDDIAGKLRLGDFERLSAWQLDLLFGNINQWTNYSEIFAPTTNKVFL